MSKSGSDISDEFEFIETPRAPTPVPPPENYGVRTTEVSEKKSSLAVHEAIGCQNYAVTTADISNSILQLKMHHSLQMALAVKASATFCSALC